MLLQFSRGRVWFVAVLATLAGTRLAPAQAELSTSYRYYYFDTAVPLAGNVEEIAVFEGAAAANSGAGLPSGLESYGIAASDVRQSPILGLWLARVPEKNQGMKEVEDLIRSIARGGGVDFVSPMFADEAGDPAVITPHLHVGFHAYVDDATAQGILAEMEAGVIEEVDWAGLDGVYRLKCGLRDGFEVLELTNALARLPDVRFAEPDMILTARKTLIPDDPYFPYQWGLHNTGQSGGTVDMDMDAPEAWDLSTGDEGIVVVILDDGVQQDHPDIHQLPGQDFTGQGTGGGPGNECDEHGTTVAGCTSATINNGLGVAGVAPGCYVASAKYTIANVPCDGNGWFYASWLVNALNWAQTSGARVTNNSNGFSPISSVTTKYQSTYDAGLVHFAASGNTGGSGVTYPASLPTVNAVGAINRYGNRAYFSTYGTGLAFVAPGQYIWTTDRTGGDGYFGGDYGPVDGTSYSSPYAAGVAALVLSVDYALAPAEVTQIMNDTCMDRGVAGYDVYYGWGIVNAYAAMLEAGAPGPTLLEGYCYYDPEMQDPVNTVAVDVFNLDTGASWPADTVDNYYSLTLVPGEDLHVDDVLRLIAKDGTTWINVTDHTVTQGDIDAENIVLDLILDEYYLDLADFPMYEADGPDEDQMAGPAVAQMILNYIWWDSTVDPTPPLTFDDQQALYDYGIPLNETPGLSYLDVFGMWHTIQDHRPVPYSQYGYNFTRNHHVDSGEMIKQVAQWLCYPVGTYGGHEEGHPYHVPAAIPAYGDYSNWMAVRGVHASENAYPLPPELDVFGFWINDPYPASLGGIGENSYKTVDELVVTYYLPLTTGDSYDGEYVAICEPPTTDPDAEVFFVSSDARFSAEAAQAISAMQAADAPSVELVAAANAWIVQAAVDGVMDELVPYDDAFAVLFESLCPGRPLDVEDANGADYFAVPFVDSETVVVVLVDATDGHFKEASWVEEPVTYLPVSKAKAWELAMEALEEQGIDPSCLEGARVDLVRVDSNPYYPHWRIVTAEYMVLWVTQDGTVTLDEDTL